MTSGLPGCLSIAGAEPIIGLQAVPDQLDAGVERGLAAEDGPNYGSVLHVLFGVAGCPLLLARTHT